MLSVKSESVKSFHESFYGTPTVDETRRRRGKKRHAVQKEEPQNEVAVIGTHYRSFDDDSMAAFVNSATALVPWNGDPKLLIDRYDVRHLLQDLTGIRRRRARPPSPDSTKEELDYERYRDVEGLENPSPPEDEEPKDENGTGGGYQRVGFDYSTGGAQSTHKEKVEEALFSPPFTVPEHLRMKIPTSTKAHQIMAGTAKYVIEHGGQAEIVLRVKQANNPTFGFLMPDHYDHEYFRFLVSHPEHVGIGPSSQLAAAADVAVAATDEEAEGGLSLLGTAYGDADEDEGEDEEVDASGDQGQEQQGVVPREVPESMDEMTKQSDDNSANSTTSKRSSTINQMSSDGGENATKDTGDSHVSLRSPSPGDTLHKEAGEVPIGVKVDTPPVLQEPAPPGVEVSGSEGTDGHEAHILSADLDHQVPPFKEPPVQLRRIIDKMVEFISRNGKEFEAIVKERDKSDQRFPFFLPWNEHYPYYSQQLEAARQVHTSGETAVAAGVPFTNESANPTQGQVAEKDQGHDSFLSGVPFWDELWPVESKGRNEDVGIPDRQDYKADKSHTGEGGMGFDAVLAAIRLATRGRGRATEGGEEADLLKAADSTERPEIGSDEAVLAAIRAATRVTKVDSSESAGKGEIVQGEGVSGAPEGLPAMKTAMSPSLFNGEAPASLDGDDVVAAHVEGNAAAVVADEDVQLPGPELAPSEKRKAERLKKAKLFAAMIKDRNGSVTNPGQLSVSTLDRQSVVLETKNSTAGTETLGVPNVVELDSREQTGQAQSQVTPEPDTGLVDGDFKEWKHKGKSKEQEEKQWKHHHRRKKDTEIQNENKHSPRTEEKRSDKTHDHYQDGKRKDRKRGHELEGTAKDSTRSVKEGKWAEKLSTQDFEDGRKDYEEERKDRSHHIYDSDRRRKEGKHEHDVERKKISRRHDLEGTRKESRHRHDSEERREDRSYKHDADQKRDRRHRHDSEERSGHGHDSDETKKERSHSHGKRRKHREAADDSDAKDGRRKERRSKKSKRHHDDARVERQSTDQRDLMDDRGLASVDSTKQDLPGGKGEDKSAPTPIDVPDDIRAKVRAMLAMM